MTGKTLRDLAMQQSAFIQEWLSIGDGEITAEQEQVLNDLIRKVDDCDAFLRRLDLEAQYFEAQAKLFAEQAKRVRNREDWFLSYIKTVMRATEQTELVGDRMKFVLQNNPAKAVIDNEELIPKEYTVIETTTKLEKKRLLEDLKLGVEIPGCHMERDQRVVSKPNSVLLNKKETA